MLALPALALLQAVASGLAPVPPPMEQETADCVRPVYASDHLVCSDPELLAIDARLKAMLPVRTTATGLEIESQDAWFRRSRLCARQEKHAQCLKSAYDERIAVVEAARSFNPQSAQWGPATCEGQSAQYTRLSSSLLALRRDGRLWLASAPSANKDWSPYLTVSEKRSDLTFDWVEGYKMDCSIPS